MSSEMIVSIFIGAIPVWVVVLVAYVIIARKGRGEILSMAQQTQSSFEDLKRRHAAIKEAVAQSEQDEQRSMRIYAVAKSLAESLSWNDMAPRLADGVQKILGAYEFLLYGLDDKGAWRQLQRRGNWAKEPPVSDLGRVTAGYLTAPQVQELSPLQAVPIHTVSATERRMSGVLFLKVNSVGNEAQLEVGREFGEQLGVALAKALLFNQMETQSRQDGLTGALRRQAFMERMDEELKKAGAFKTTLSVLMVDIDHFKHVNDGHGHAAGDAVLTRTGQILREAFYETDVVGRYGGEEFVILLPHADPVGVMRKAEALRERFEREVIPSGFENLRITVSIGLSHYPQHGRTGDELIASADRALYRAKETGRNRVVAA